MNDPLLVVCRSCDGLAFRLSACPCRRGGDSWLVEAAERSDGSAWRECRLCEGVGTVAAECRDCGGHGLRRAQLVLTVADRDTGAVASAEVVPGAVAPVPDPGHVGRWRLDLLPVLHRLASEVGVAEPHMLAYPMQPVTRIDLPLPRDWAPGLPVDERHKLEAVMLAAWSATPWWVYTGHSRPGPPVEPAAAIGELCRLAELLLLDLVVEARQVHGDALGWQLRFEIPGSGVPDVMPGWSTDLPAAVAATTVTEALRDLAWRGRDAPAHYLSPPAAAPRAPLVDVDQLARRIAAHCLDNRGAQAIWRDGRWQHAGIRTGKPSERFFDRETGQLARYVSTELERTWDPPPPSFWGDPVPGEACPACRVPPLVNPSVCRRCGDSRRVLHGAIVTVTDLDRRATHRNWPAESAPLTSGEGQRCCGLPHAYRINGLADDYGVDAAELVDTDHGRPVDSRLLDEHAHDAGHGPDALRQHFNTLTRGRAAGRIIVAATTSQAVPDLVDVIRLAVGLDLAAHVSVRHDPGRCTESWTITLHAPGVPPAELPGPGLPTTRLAAAHCLEYLESELIRTEPTDPHEPLRVPQQPTPATVADPTAELISRARSHPGTWTTTVVDRTGRQPR